MISIPQVRAFAPQEWQTYRDLRLLALAESPEAFGRTLAEEQLRPDEAWASRLRAGVASELDLPLLAEAAGQPVGLAWGRIEPASPDVAHLYQMWVAPGHRRRGVGGRLLAAVVAWSQARQASYLELGVTLGDTPARRLYERAGFAPVGGPKLLRPGSSLMGQRMRLDLHTGAV